MLKQLLFGALFFCSFLGLKAQIINFPDPALKDALVNQIVVDTDFDGIFDDDVDTNNDGEVQISEALAVQVLGLVGKEIFNMRGIEEFVNLTTLIANYNNYDQIDTSTMADLQVLVVAFSQLESLDVSQNLQLKRLELDFNHIENLDVSNNLMLEKLWLTFNEVTQLDVSANVNLINLNADSNNLSSLDVSANTALEYLAVDNNELTEIDLSANPNLTFVDVYGNQLTELDLSAQTQLTLLTCLNNDLEVLNIQNGNNDQITFLNAENNPNLLCIQVDDPDYANTQDWVVDSGVEFSDNCNFLGLDDLRQTQWVLAPNPTTGAVSIKYPSVDPGLLNWDIRDTTGRLMADFEGSPASLDLSAYPGGVYFIRTQDIQGRLQVQKLVKR